MRIFIDNDGCPRAIRDHVFKIAERRQIGVLVVGNSYLKVPPSPLFRMEVVSGGFDAADDHIVATCAAGDLIITADVPLAARIVANGAQALSPYGEVFDK